MGRNLRVRRSRACLFYAGAIVDLNKYIDDRVQAESIGLSSGLVQNLQGELDTTGVVYDDVSEASTLLSTENYQST